MVIGHFDLVTLHRVSDRNRGMIDGWIAVIFQIRLYGERKFGVVSAAQGLDSIDLAWRAFQCEARIGAADIGQ